MYVRPTVFILTMAVTSSAAAQFTGIPNDTQITLARTSCLGECPVYSVSIDSQGNVVYEGSEHVRVVGRQTARIPLSEVLSVLEVAQRIRFLGLDDQYRVIRNPDGSISGPSDLPTTIVTIIAEGTSKRVEDYFGTPPGLKELERRIDEAARTRRWISLDEETLEQMLQSGWSPTLVERAELLRRALNNDDAEVVRRLMALGEDPNITYFESHTTALMLARSAAVTRVLLDAGANPNVINDNGGTPLGHATYLASDVAEALLQAGAFVDAPFLNDQTALIHAACVGNAGVVAVLLDAGANPAVRSFPSGASAIDCAREARGVARSLKHTLIEQPPYAQDFDRVIPLLQRALERQKR